MKHENCFGTVCCRNVEWPLIVYVDQVMSKCCACKFLYGETTSPEEIRKLENALETQTEFKTEAEFYRKNGQLLVAFKIRDQTEHKSQ